MILLYSHFILVYHVYALLFICASCKKSEIHNVRKLSSCGIDWRFDVDGNFENLWISTWQRHVIMKIILLFTFHQYNVLIAYWKCDVSRYFYRFLYLYPFLWHVESIIMYQYLRGTDCHFFVVYGTVSYSCLEFRILYLEGSVLSFISPSSGGSPGPI